MSKVIHIWWNGGDGPVRIPATAYPTPVPGLVINAHHKRPGVWVVTHEASGAAVLKLDDPEAALYAALRLGELEDWTLPGTVLKPRPVARKVRALARELGCAELTYGSGGTLTAAQLASAEGGQR